MTTIVPLADEGVVTLQDKSSDVPPRIRRRRPHYRSSSLHESLKTIAGIAGNILEVRQYSVFDRCPCPHINLTHILLQQWYDFAVFGFFSDILGQVFFPKDQPEDLSVMESFIVFGFAFLLRPIGGLVR